MKSFLLALVILLGSSESLAAPNKSDGLWFNGAIFIPQSSIKNPNSSVAYYSGVGLEGKTGVTLVDLGAFSTSFYGSIRYFDLRNTANTGTQKEFANHIGTGAGLKFMFAKLYLEADYHYMLARHYSVGTISYNIDYEYTPLTYSAGISLPIGQLAFGASYSVSSAMIAGSKTGLSQDSEYNDTRIMLNVTWNTGASLFGFFSKLFN